MRSSGGSDRVRQAVLVDSEGTGNGQIGGRVTVVHHPVWRILLLFVIVTALQPASPLQQASGKRSILRWSAGPTLETSPIRQVCWYKKLRACIREE